MKFTEYEKKKYFINKSKRLTEEERREILSGYSDRELANMSIRVLAQLVGRPEQTVRNRVSGADLDLRTALIANSVSGKGVSKNRTMKDVSLEYGVNYNTLAARRKRFPDVAIDELAQALKEKKVRGGT